MIYLFNFIMFTILAASINMLVHHLYNYKKMKDNPDCFSCFKNSGLEMNIKTGECKLQKSPKFSV